MLGRVNSKQKVDQKTLTEIPLPVKKSLYVILFIQQLRNLKTIFLDLNCVWSYFA